MERHDTDVPDRREAKRREHTREEQLAQRPVTLDELVDEVGSELFALGDPEEIAEFTDAHRERLSRHQFCRYVAWMVEQYGAPMARRAGLPVGRPRLRLAS